MKCFLLSFFCFLSVFVQAKDFHEGSAAVSFKAKSTLHGFSGEALVPDFPVDSNDGTCSWEAKLPVREISTGLGKRDRNMWKMFHGDSFPVITASFQHFLLDNLEEGSTIPFTLTMFETTMNLNSTVTKVWEENDLSCFTLSFPISLEKFHLEPPGFLFISVNDNVNVEVDFKLR